MNYDLLLCDLAVMKAEWVCGGGASECVVECVRCGRVGVWWWSE